MIGDRPNHAEINGGITPEAVPMVVAADTAVLLTGSAVFKGGCAKTPEVYIRNSPPSAPLAKRQ
jgi:pentose-5-phosphate-3-epimerase